MPKPRHSSMQEEFHRIAKPRTLAVLASSLLVPMAAFMVYPFLIIYLTHTLGLSVSAAGFLLSLRFLSSGFLGFIGGAVADRLGMRLTYLLAGAATAVTLYAMGQERSIPILGILLVVLGITASTVNAMARGLIHESVDEADRGLAQNYVHWLNNVGMAAGLPLSALVLSGGYSRIPFDVSAAVYLVMAVALYAAFSGGRSATAAIREQDPGPKARPVAPWIVVREDAAFAWLLVSFLLVVAVEMQFESGVPLDLSLHFPHGARLYGTLGVIDMAVVVVLQLVVSHWLNQPKSSGYGYLGMLAVGGLMIGGLWQTVFGWTLSIVLLGVGDVFAYGQIFHLMGTLPKPGREGSYFGLLGMVQGLATFFAYGLGSEAYQFLHAGWTFGLTLPVTLAAIFALRQSKVWTKRQHAEPAPVVG
jgi:MFS family permease